MAQASPEGPYQFKYLSSSGQVSTSGRGCFVRAFGLNVTTNAGSAQLKDGGASGTAGPRLALDGGTALGSVASGEMGPVRFNSDCYCTLSGTGATAWVVYAEDSD